MIYRDLLKISIYFVAIKLFIDFSSQLPEKIYNIFYLKTGGIGLNIIFYSLINLFFIMLLIIKGGFFIDRVFKGSDNFFKEDLKSNTPFKIALVVCAYYVILNSLFSLLASMTSFQFNLYAVGIFVSIIISLLILFFSDKIANKFKM